MFCSVFRNRRTGRPAEGPLSQGGRTGPGSVNSQLFYSEHLEIPLSVKGNRAPVYRCLRITVTIYAPAAIEAE